MPVGELIGVAFDDNSVWEKCSIGELKILIHLALQNLDDAKNFTEMLVAFNDILPERRKFYQVLNNILDILLNKELVFDHYIPSLTRMYGEELLNNALSTASGEVRFFGLAPTNMQLEGIDKHQRLIESYKKLHRARKNSKG